jgi:hypothetical protein
VGLFSVTTTFLGEWTVYGNYTAPGKLPGAGVAAWITNWMWVALFGSLLWMLAIFPDGRALNRRWKMLTGTTIALFAGCLLAGAMIETPMSSAYQVPNPFVTERLATAYNILFGVGIMAMVAAILSDLGAVLARFRRARGRERQQMKWLLSGVTLMAVMALTGLSLSLALGINAGDLLVNASFLGALVGIGVAMLRHRLYDIDLIIRRTLIYGAVTALLALVYFGGVALLQSLFSAMIGEQSSLAIVISTLAIAALFTPLRNRMQRFVDRRFYRQKYDAERTVEQFSQTMRDEVDLDQMTAELTEVVDRVMQPQQISLWLQPIGKAKPFE